MLKEHVNAYKVEQKKFLLILLFNYLSCNGDAHLKNFSLFRDTNFEDYRLTPAYDFLNTSMHIGDETDTAFDLFKDDYMIKGSIYSGLEKNFINTVY